MELNTDLMPGSCSFWVDSETPYLHDTPALWDSKHVCYESLGLVVDIPQDMHHTKPSKLLLQQYTVDGCWRRSLASQYYWHVLAWTEPSSRVHFHHTSRYCLLQCKKAMLVPVEHCISLSSHAPVNPVVLTLRIASSAVECHHAITMLSNSHVLA